MTATATLLAQGRRAIKRAIEFQAARLPVRRPKHGRLVLAYHGVASDDAPARGERTLHLAAREFGAQMKALSSLGDVVTLRELLEADHPNGRLIAVSFDDAYDSALTYGIPQCAVRKIPCSVFVSPSLLAQVPPWDVLADNGTWTVSQREEFLWRGDALRPYQQTIVSDSFAMLRIASESELRTMLEEFPQVTLGNHTQHHLNLGALSDEAVLREVTRADAWLRSFAAHRYLPFIAYPFGIPPRPAALNTLLQSGEFGMLAQGGWMPSSARIHRFLLPRWNVPADVTLDGFRARVRGFFQKGPTYR